MDLKIFISYYSKDSNKMQMLKKLINDTNNLIPIVIAERRNSLVPLTKKVEDGIRESHIIIPILTRESLTSQWVNQEVGYATALQDIKIMPIIDNHIINDLKGFIHKQVDLSYNFQSFYENKRKEGIHFKKCINKLISDIMEEYNIETSSNAQEEIPEIENPNNFIKTDNLKDIKIYEPKTQLKTTIIPYIKNNSGILSFWAEVQNHHNIIKPIKRHLYIASSYSNNYLAAPNLARYPNMWAILRETPTSDDKSGKWSFICNGEEENRTSIDYYKPLSNGWHLFSVEWSIQMDFIRFYIDTKLIGERTFINWPGAFNYSMYIGTWPDKNPKSQFYSRISEPLFVGEIDSRILKETYSHKPTKLNEKKIQK
jgi:hypothetical protein